MNSKFLFETEFDADADDGLPGASARMPTYTEVELLAVKEAAYLEGFQKARDEAREETESQIVKDIRSLLGMTDTLLRKENERQADQEAAVLKAIKTIVAQIMPAYMEKHRADEILALVQKTLTDLREEPKMVIRLSQPTLDELEPRINDIIKATHFQGKIALMADPSFTPGDCRVEWADGGVERIESKLMGAVEQAVHRQLSAYEHQTPPSHAADVFSSETITTTV